MQIEYRKKKEKMFISLEGSLDTTTSAKLEAFFEENLGDTKKLEIDMKKLEYISSSGLRVLLAVRGKVTKLGGYVLIKHMNETVASVFKITGFSGMFVIK